MTVTVGTLAEGTIPMMGEPGMTETILGRVIEVTATTATIEGMITVRTSPGEPPVEIEIPETIRLPHASVTPLT